MSRSGASYSCEGENGLVEDETRNYPLLRALLSMPPLCPMSENYALIQQISSDQQVAECGEVPNLGKRKRAPRANNQRRQSSTKRGSSSKPRGPKDSDSVQVCCSPDTTVKSPPKVEYSRPYPPLDETAPLSVEQQNFLSNLLSSSPVFNDPEKLQLAATMGISEQKMIQWVSDQFTSNTNEQNRVEMSPSTSAPPILVHHDRYGTVEYYPAKPLEYGPGGPISMPQDLDTRHPKRMRHDDRIPFNVYSANKHCVFKYPVNYKPQTTLNYQPPCEPYGLNSQWQYSHSQPMSVTAEMQYEELADSRYQTITPPSEDPAALGSTYPLENQANTTVNSMLWDDVYVATNKTLPRYEDISPSTENPTTYFPTTNQADDVVYCNSGSASSSSSDVQSFTSNSTASSEYRDLNSVSSEAQSPPEPDHDPERSVKLFLQLL